MQDKIETSIIVFSGTSSSGKSTTIRKMREIGYSARDVEIAREYIEDLQDTLREQNPSDTEEMIFKKFCDLAKTPVLMTSLLKKKLAYEQSLDNINQLTIIDNALACGMAYPKLFKCEIESQLEQEIKERLSHYRYKIIFSFEKLDLVEDGIRFENEQERTDLHNELREQYRALGYTYISVPPMNVIDPALSQEDRINLSVIKRVNFIHGMIKSITSPAVKMNGIETKLFSNCEAQSLFPYSKGPNQQFYASFFAHSRESAANDSSTLQAAATWCSTTKMTT